MDLAKFVAAKMAEFDALPDLPASVTLIHYPTEELWARSPEPFCAHAEAVEINLMLAHELKKRNVPVIFKTAFFKSAAKLELAFGIKQTPDPAIGWAVLEVPAEPVKPFNELKFIKNANDHD